MPRREAFDGDEGDDSLMGPPSRSRGGIGGDSSFLSSASTFSYPPPLPTQAPPPQQMQQLQPLQQEDPELMELERRLNEEVDEEFFQEPKQFHTLRRVIDVLGLQMIDDATVQSSATDLQRNPAYRNLKRQEQIVEGAIEHMAVIHCADLNHSVFRVGRVARQFNDAVAKVRHLRKQVRDIQDTLGSAAGGAHHHHAHANPNEPGLAAREAAGAASGGGRTHNAAAMSLRELWLKKLESEAVLSLLDKLDVIRAAPTTFDRFIQPPGCRIGAAVLCLTQALHTMFSDDVAQVQALHKIMEQLMLRKQKAEEILWDTLHQVVYLRTANGALFQASSSSPTSITTARKRGKDEKSLASGGAGGNKPALTSGQSVSSESRRSSNNRVTFASATTPTVGSTAATVSSAAGMINPFCGPHFRFATDDDLEEEDYEDLANTALAAAAAAEDLDDQQTVDSNASGASLFSLEDPGGAGLGGEEASNSRDNVSALTTVSTTQRGRQLMMIPIPLVDAELDLEADEQRCLEEVALLGGLHQNTTKQQQQQRARGTRLQLGQLPRYADPVLALRILVECLALLKRLDDVERVLHEGLSREIRLLVQREQARTFARLEKRRLLQTLRPGSGATSSNMSNIDPGTAVLKDFRRHLTGLLSAFGCVLLRLAHLAEILRFRISGDKELLQQLDSPSTVMRSVLSSALEMMNQEIKDFLKACLYETDTARNDTLDSAVRKSSTAYETGFFSLGIVDDEGLRNRRSGKPTVSTATRSNVMEMSVARFVSTVLFSKSKSEPQVRHALIFRRSVARWTQQVEAMNKELAMFTGEDISAPSFRSPSPEDTAIAFLDKVIQTDLLPVLQEEAVNGTVKGLERRDAFDPVLERTLYSQPNSNDPQHVEMCFACKNVYVSSGPLFMALHRLPRDGEMYMPLVAVLEHVMLTFISRVTQQVDKICNNKSAWAILHKDSKEHSFTSLMERRRPFTLLMQAYSNGDVFETSAGSGKSGIMPLAPPSTDTTPRKASNEMKVDSPVGEDVADGVEGEEAILKMELTYLNQYLDFASDGLEKLIVLCSDEELMKASCLAHSLLKLSSLLDNRLMMRGANKALTSTRALREAIKTIRTNGVKMAMFCRLDMLMQCISRMSKVCRSTTLAARDAVRIPSSVNDLGEYLTGASDNLREAAGNAVTAYTFSSLEQYIPLCLIQSVRVVAAGKGVVAKTPLTMNGIEALDRSGSVLYRDLKGSTGFDNSFWDVELAAVSFERSASFIAMMELEMEELVAYYAANRGDFSEEDFELMFSMTGPRRRGDVGRYHMTKRQLR